MADPARIDDVADGVVAKLKELWPTMADPDGVEKTWLARLSWNANDTATLTVGRRVFVVPGNPAMSPLTRDSWLNKYLIGVVVCEVYTDGDGDPPAAWIAERVKWWQDTILYPLANPDLVVVGPAGVAAGVMPDPETPPDVVVFLDRDALDDGHAVVIQTNFTFMDRCDHTGAG